MTFRENEELYSSLKISDDYEVEGKGEKVNVKDLSVYKMIFNDSSLSSFLAESSSSLSSDPYFLELLKAYQSEGDFYSGSDLLKSISNSKDLSGVNLYGVNLYEAKNIFIFNKINGRSCYAIIFKDNVYIKAGCFWGTLDQFENEALEKYGSDSVENYSLQINYLKTIKTYLNPPPSFL